jgi:hypothetical protein
MTPELCARDYRASFLRYLPRHDEAALHSGYLLGRAAVTDGVSLLELVRIHHDVLLEVLRDTSVEEAVDLTESASAFLAEVLATFDMTQRALREPH